MTETTSGAQPSLLPTIYAGWQTYQSLLITALHPLSPDQLALRAAPHVRSIGEIVTHIIGARARWFYQLWVKGAKRSRCWARGTARGCRPGVRLS